MKLVFGTEEGGVMTLHVEGPKGKSLPMRCTSRDDAATLWYSLRSAALTTAPDDTVLSEPRSNVGASMTQDDAQVNVDGGQEPTE